MSMTKQVVLAGVLSLTAALSADASQAQQAQPPQGRRLAADTPAQGQGQGQGQRGRGQGQGQAGMPAVRPGTPVQQMQAMFDAYALVQAQRALQLTDEQYQRFFVPMNRLQDVRRRHMQERTRLLAELRRTSRLQGSDESLAGLIRQLDDVEMGFVNDARAARAAIDDVLTAWQRASFRLFEDDMERQKAEFITRSRQAGRGQ